MNQNGLILVALVFLVVAGIMFAIRRNYKEHPILLISSVVFLCAVVLYREYLVGNLSYLYSVVDGYSQYLPNYMNYVYAVKEGTNISWWTFSNGFGAIQSFDVLLYPLNLIPVLIGALAGEKMLLITFAWMQVLKMVLAAIFMYKFLRKLDLDIFPCCNMSVIYAFSGIIVLRGFWGYLADECFIIPLLLFAAECYFKDKKWQYIPPTIFLLASCLGMYYLYLYGLILVIYATVRCIYAKYSLKQYFTLILICGGLFILGVLMWCVAFVGFSSGLFSSARFSSTVEAASGISIFESVDWRVILSGILSMFDTSSTGVFDNYTGVLNYLERPLFYCGIGCMFFVPQAIIYAEKRLKRLIAFGLSAAGIYMMFPLVTDIFNAFIRNEELGVRSYRLSSLWIVIMIIVIAAYGLQSGIRNGGYGKTSVLATSVIITIIFNYCCMAASQNDITINYSVCRWVVVFVVVWLLFFLNSKFVEEKGKYRFYSFAFLMCISLAEVGHSAKMVIDGARQTARTTYEQMEKDVLGYYGDAAEAVDYIKKYDTGLYRIAGVRTGVGAATYCSPLYFNIFDSSYYTNIDSGTYEFINEVYPESFINGVGSKYSVGVGDNLILSTLTGYKYIITSYENHVVPQGYRYLETIGKVKIYENKNALSIGITYDSYIRKSIFSKYDDEVQRLILLSSVVLSDDANTELREVSIKELDELKDDIERRGSNLVYNDIVQERKKDMLKITSWLEDDIIGTISVSEDKFLVLSIPNVAGWTIFVDGEAVETQNANIGFMGIYLEEGEHTVEAKYQPKTIIPGVVITLCAVGIYVGLIIVDKKISNKKQKNERT
ncbi:YfhO family protein [Frisingicoccus sp.]|uniref:YfhO family protein n=1 Tax=Frisingicoccus sp. TaxID=1918627 RepID=UPI003994C3B6